MWEDDDNDFVGSGIPAGTITPLSIDEYLSLVSSNEISTISQMENSDVTIGTTMGGSSHGFYRRIGQTLVEHCESSKVHTMTLDIDQLLIKSNPDPSSSLLNAPAVAYPFLDYISRTTSLKHLDWDLDPEDDPFDDADQISNAIIANQSITELTMRPWGSVPNSLMRDILNGLPSRPPLEKLHINSTVSGETLLAENSGFSMYYQSLAERNEKLSQLKLTYIHMDDSLCEFLLDTHHGRAERIVLRSSVFDLDACYSLALLMQKPPANNERRNGVDLSIRLYCEEEECAPPLPAAFLLPSAGHIRLRELEIMMEMVHNAPILAYHLPQSQYINKLSVYFVPHEGPIVSTIFDVVPREFHYSRTDPVLRRQQMLEGIRRNGSLHCLQLNDDIPFFSAEEDGKVQAYLERNKRLPVLLANPRLEYPRPDKDEKGQGTTELEFFPPLFCAASEADAMAPTNVLIGLISARTEHGVYVFGRNNLGGRTN